MKRAFFYMIIVLGIFSSTNSFAREAKTLKLLLDIPQDFCLHAINSPIINQNNSPFQNLYFDADLTEEDNDDISNSDRRKCSFGKIILNIDLFFTSTTYQPHAKTAWFNTNSFSLPSFYFNSLMVLRL